MKRIIALTGLLLAMWSCTTLTKIDAYSHMNKVDFAAYSQKGFLITPEKYNGEYESIGIIDFVKMPGAVYSNLKDMEGNNKYIPEHSNFSKTSSQWFYEFIDLDKAINELYEECLSMGADAIMNFDFELNEDSYTVDYSNPTKVTGYRITGFAIKRKK